MLLTEARVYAMPFTTASTMWQLSFPCGEEEAVAFEKDKRALKAEIERRCHSWHAPIPRLLAATRVECMSGYRVYDRELLEPLELQRAKDRCTNMHSVYLLYWYKRTYADAQKARC
jgi:hypothetical protein